MFAHLIADVFHTEHREHNTDGGQQQDPTHHKQRDPLVLGDEDRHDDARGEHDGGPDGRADQRDPQVVRVDGDKVFVTQSGNR